MHVHQKKIKLFTTFQTVLGGSDPHSSDIQLPIYAVQHPRRAMVSFTLWQKPVPGNFKAHHKNQNTHFPTPPKKKAVFIQQSLKQLQNSIFGAETISVYVAQLLQ